MVQPRVSVTATIDPKDYEEVKHKLMRNGLSVSQYLGWCLKNYDKIKELVKKGELPDFN